MTAPMSPSKTSPRGNLRVILEDEVLAKEFHLFLASERSEENFFFYKQVEEFKLRQFDETSLQDDVALAKKIYSNFMKNDNINISDETKASIRETIEKNPQNTNNALFSVAQKEIYELMSLDAYPRFIASPKYQEVLFHRFCDQLSSIEGKEREIKEKTFHGTFTGFEGVAWVLQNKEKIGPGIFTKDQAKLLFQMAMDNKLIVLLSPKGSKEFSESEEYIYALPVKHMTPIRVASEDSILSMEDSSGSKTIPSAYPNMHKRGAFGDRFPFLKGLKGNNFTKSETNLPSTTKSMHTR